MYSARLSRDLIFPPLRRYTDPSQIPPPVQRLPAKRACRPATRPPRSSPLDKTGPQMAGKGSSLAALRQDGVTGGRQGRLPRRPGQDGAAGESQRHAARRLTTKRGRRWPVGAPHPTSRTKRGRSGTRRGPHLLTLDRMGPQTSRRDASLLSPDRTGPQSGQRGTLLAASRQDGGTD